MLTFVEYFAQSRRNFTYVDLHWWLSVEHFVYVYTYSAGLLHLIVITMQGMSFMISFLLKFALLVYNVVRCLCNLIMLISMAVHVR